MTCEPRFSSAAGTRVENPVYTYGKNVILELKFTDRFPDWFRDLTRVFDLMQYSAAKYAEGVTLLGEHRFHDGYTSRDWYASPTETEASEHLGVAEESDAGEQQKELLL
jgi:hypothetical protein